MWRGENHALSSIRATFICRYIIHAPTSRVLFLFPRQGDSAEGRAGGGSSGAENGMERERVAGQASRAALLRAAVLSTSRVCPGWAGYVGFRPRETGVRRSAGRAGRERRHWRGPVLGQTGASCCRGRGARVVFQGGGAPPREQAGFSFKHGASRRQSPTVLPFAPSAGPRRS